jgi:hypothetical protein
MSKVLNRHFSKEEIQMFSGNLKKFSTTLFIREMHTKTTLTYYFIPVRMAVNQKDKRLGCQACLACTMSKVHSQNLGGEKRQKTSCWLGCGEREPCTLLVGM